MGKPLLAGDHGFLGWMLCLVESGSAPVRTNFLVPALNMMCSRRAPRRESSNA
jgi:hypothetical protein